MKKVVILSTILLAAIAVGVAVWSEVRTYNRVESLQDQVASIQKSVSLQSQESNRQYREDNPELFKESVLRELDFDLDRSHFGGTDDAQVKDHYSSEVTRYGLWLNLLTLVNWYREGVADKFEVASRCRLVDQLTDQYFTSTSYQTLNYYWSYRVAQLCSNIPAEKI